MAFPTQNKNPFGGGGGLFGPSTSSAQSTGFSFGPATAASSGFGFGSTQTTTQSAGFGGLAFGVGNTGLFNAAATNQPTAFGGLGTAGFGNQTGGGGLFGGTTTGLGTTSGFGFGASNAFKPSGGIGSVGMSGITQTGAAAQHHTVNNLTCLKLAITNPTIFGDERDQVIAKWNQLQSCWGVGKGFYNQQGAFVEFNPDNLYSLLKAVGYSCISDSKNEDGLVNLVFGRSQSEVSANQQQIVDVLHKILGGKTNHIICVDSIKSFQDDKCEMTIYVQDRQVTGVTMRIVASELFTFLNQQTVRQLLTQLCILDVYIKVAMTKEQMKYYLDNPPAGIDHRIWEQAKIDNPSPDKLLPVPIVGFSELHQRLKYQDQQTEMHRLRLEVITSDLASLKCKMADVMAKIDEFKRRQVLVSHRVLQVMVKQEIARKQGYAIQAEEEQLSTQLEAIAAELNAPTQFKGRLNELMSQIRLQNQALILRSDVGYQIGEEIQQEVKQHLNRQQEGVTHLVQILKDDLSDLKIIEQGLLEASKLRR